MKSELLDQQRARTLIHSILSAGDTAWSRHALDEMRGDRYGEITRVDVVNALRGGVVDPPELEKGTWRYRLRTAKIVVIISFRSTRELVVITAWRTGR